MTRPQPKPLAPVDPALASRILQAVKAGFDEQLAFVEELITYPSERGREAPAQDLVAGALARRGYSVERWVVREDDIRHHPAYRTAHDYDNAINVVGTYRSRTEAGRSLILNGHIDVVPAGPLDRWTSPPYQPRRDGDWLYGRGGGDMKAGIAANIFAVDALRRLGLQPAGTIYQQSVTEEECTGNGSLACLVHGYRADAVICPEPEDDKLVRACVGVFWARIVVRGAPAHPRAAASGASAILSAYRLIGELMALADSWSGEKHRHRHFEAVDHPINFNVGRIEGGDWTSSVPAECTFHLRIAIYPGDDHEARKRDIEACLARAAATGLCDADAPPRIEWYGNSRSGYVLEPGSEAEAVLARAHRRAFGQDLESLVTPGGLDGGFFVIWDGIPCLTYGPLAENIHGFDERVKISSIAKITGAIALFIAEWCGLEPVAS